jgi:Fe-Mn family superoxide dismutase
MRSARWLLLNGNSIPEDIRGGVLHNAGGHFNHSLFWRAMSPSSSTGPRGSLSASINRAFGSLQQFQTRFEEAGARVFGSGWVWLVVAREKQTSMPRLEVVTTTGHENPLQHGQSLARQRRLGARLLPEIRESTFRVLEELVVDRQLEDRRAPFRAS